jgi:hypothetical protein
LFFSHLVQAQEIRIKKIKAQRVLIEVPAEANFKRGEAFVDASNKVVVRIIAVKPGGAVGQVIRGNATPELVLLKQQSPKKFQIHIGFGQEKKATQLSANSKAIESGQIFNLSINAKLHDDFFISNATAIIALSYSNTSGANEGACGISEKCFTEATHAGLGLKSDIELPFFKKRVLPFVGILGQLPLSFKSNSFEKPTGMLPFGFAGLLLRWSDKKYNPGSVQYVFHKYVGKNTSEIENHSFSIGFNF